MDSIPMPLFDNPRDRASSRSTHPVNETLSRYLAMTTPARPRAGAEDHRPYAPEGAGLEGSAQSRAEEIWDALGDFA
jgi:hypothetical protein